MDGPRGDALDTRFGELEAEAAEALAYAANTLRSARDRYRQAYLQDFARWRALADSLDGLERDEAPVADAGAPAQRLRATREEVGRARDDLAAHEGELSHLELAIRNLESTWLFLKDGDSSLISEPGLPVIPSELQMRIVQAQESERARLAQEIHDGPAQAFSNAIFQVEFIERVLDSDPASARDELRLLRELLLHALDDARTSISQLRPSVIEELGLDGSIADTVGTQASISGLRIETELAAPSDSLSEAAQTVALRIVQEALQNVRKHAAATNVVVRTMLDDGQWVLEIRDDGHGFDTGAVAARGRRNFGLQFMRERAELIGATFEVQSGPETGTVVRLAIPVAHKENG